MTVISGVIADVDQEFPVGWEDVKVTDPPAQKEVGPLAVTIGAAGIGFTVIVTGAEAGETQPFPSVWVTVYVPLLLTVIELAVEPLDHKLLEP